MYTDLFRMLDQEALVVRSCLSSGLTELRTANLNDKGRFYSAFYQLSIGIERFAKLGLILDHLAQHNLVAPGKSAVKGFGHDLLALIANLESTAQRRGYKISTPFIPDPLVRKILDFLSDFSKGMRYANLDGLSTGVRQRNPLAEWAQIANDALSNVPTSTTQRLRAQASAVATAIEDKTLVLASGLDDNPLNTRTALATPALLDVCAKHLIWAVLQLLAPMRDFVVEASDTAHQIPAASPKQGDSIPYMSEYFDFIWLDWSYVKRKKKWP